MDRADAHSLTRVRKALQLLQWAIAAGIALFCFLLGSCDPAEEGYRHGEAYYLSQQYSTFSDDDAYFLQSILAAQSRLNVPGRELGFAGGRVRLGIVSHHLLIRDLIAEFFLRLSTESHPKTVVLLAPNHTTRGSSQIAISELPWKTPFGVLQTDSELGRAFRGVARVEEDAFYNEHSIGAILPFLRYVFPGARHEITEEVPSQIQDIMIEKINSNALASQ